jgi:mono/diheme cytochrome c family protein
MKRHYIIATLPFMFALPGVAAAQNSTQQGQAIFEKWCAPCHAPLTKEHDRLPGTSTLGTIYKGTKPAALQQRTDLTTAVVTYFVRHGVNAMPPFRKTEITDAQLVALSAYLSRNTHK